MARASIVPFLAETLEPYLEAVQRAWRDTGRPTLPVTDGKVNVRQIVRELAKRDPRVQEHHEQHFFRKAELRSAVNAVAEEQGLDLIGSRTPDETHEAARRRIGKLAGEASDLRSVVAEREAVIDSLRRENASLREQLRMLEEIGMVFRAGPVR
jgi:hypothetical protein